MEVSYNSNKVDGMIMKKENTQTRPNVTFTSSGYFTLILRDPDAPGGNYLHWLICNIKDGDIKKGNEIITYYGPNPPSSHKHIHHYIFELYKQKELIDCSLYSDSERSNFDINGIITKFGLELIDSKMFMVDPLD